MKKGKQPISNTSVFQTLTPSPLCKYPPRPRQDERARPGSHLAEALRRLIASVRRVLVVPMRNPARALLPAPLVGQQRHVCRERVGRGRVRLAVHTPVDDGAAPLVALVLLFAERLSGAEPLLEAVLRAYQVVQVQHRVGVAVHVVVVALDRPSALGHRRLPVVAAQAKPFLRDNRVIGLRAVVGVVGDARLVDLVGVESVGCAGVELESQSGEGSQCKSEEGGSLHFCSDKDGKLTC
ncbi:hypothetical protein BJ170DRAFT_622111 [Xylariales sp. AK1849]|nr:hypothetical protein BJ170DRAFT_622111 [Xylariales sp. AK1849]